MAGQTAGLITPRFSEAPPWSGPAIRWYSQACPVCMGDVHEAAADDGWGTCLICARSFPVVELLANARRPGALVIGEPLRRVRERARSS